MADDSVNDDASVASDSDSEAAAQDEAGALSDSPPEPVQPDAPGPESAKPPAHSPRPRSEFQDEWPGPGLPEPRASARRTALLGLAFVAPCVVIALSLYFIVKGGAPREVPPSAPSNVAPTTDAEAPAPAALPEPTTSSAPSLEKPEAEVAVVPGFEDEGNDEEPSPAKHVAPKHFATVQEAAAGSCSTESVDGLSRQIIEQARCLKPNEFAPLPKRPNLQMAAHVYPYLDLGARDHLVKALDAHTTATMTVNSCLRTVAQQYLVSRWSVSKTCGVQLATPPGESNHEIGTALDIKEAGTWRPALEAQQFRWLGSSDRVHFDYKGAATAPHTATDVLAFQKLWNKNHKDDAIVESGRYDAATEARLKKAPPGGFAQGAGCAKAGARAH